MLSHESHWSVGQEFCPHIQEEFLEAQYRGVGGLEAHSRESWRRDVVLSSDFGSGEPPDESS